ncbi:MAG TPA: hypothetical protein VK991_04585 [Halomonas sp.]|nr:hypothetical protein [Halomonas sp.]
MTAYQLLPMLGYMFNIIGIVLCIVGLTLARNKRRRVIGGALAVLGFVVAASPMLVQLLGLVEPPPSGIMPPQ